MKETTRARETTQAIHDTHADINQASKFALGMVIGFAGLIGVWSMACMVGALSTQGLGGIIKGFLTAVTGI